MRSILVANAKGGAGKTTLAVNLAGALAARGDRTALLDLDRQKSSWQWLAVRGEQLPHIRRSGDSPADDRGLGDEWLVVDSPAGLHGKNLARTVKMSGVIIVPIQPSLFDMSATGNFLADLAEEAGRRRAAVGIVAMRVDPRTRAAATLDAFLGQFNLPVITYLRDTQLYANAAFGGQSIFDLPGYVASREVAQWGPLIEWLDEA
jgi:chromosome partitioning protein